VATVGNSTLPTSQDSRRSGADKRTIDFRSLRSSCERSGGWQQSRLSSLRCACEAGHYWQPQLLLRTTEAVGGPDAPTSKAMLSATRSEPFAWPIATTSSPKPATASPPVELPVSRGTRGLPLPPSPRGVHRRIVRRCIAYPVGSAWPRSFAESGARVTPQQLTAAVGGVITTSCIPQVGQINLNPVRIDSILSPSKNNYDKWAPTLHATFGLRSSTGTDAARIEKASACQTGCRVSRREPPCSSRWPVRALACRCPKDYTSTSK
jgi:hypothetical protein